MIDSANTNEIAALLRPIAATQTRGLCQEVLATREQRVAYEACDGTKAGRDIATVAGVSPASVSTWSKRWRELGLVIENSDRFLKHQFSLNSLGIPLDPASEFDA